MIRTPQWKYGIFAFILAHLILVFTTPSFSADVRPVQKLPAQAPITAQNPPAGTAAPLSGSVSRSAPGGIPPIVVNTEKVTVTIKTSAGSAPALSASERVELNTEKITATIKQTVTVPPLSPREPVVINTEKVTATVKPGY